MSFSEISAFIAIVAAINGLFAGVEIKLRTPYKESLARWLRGQARPDESWATTFRALFDHVFAVRTFTGPKGTCYWLPSIGRSFVGSMSLVLVLYMVYASLLPADMTISLRYGLVDDPRNAYLGIPYDWVILRGEQVVVAQSIAVAFVLPLFLNLIPDYFWLYPGFATDDEVFPDPKRCRYRTGTAERKYGEFGRFLHKRIDGIESVAGQGWTAHGQSVDFAASGDRVHRARTAATSWKPLVG